jgi:hypothetical protein
MHYVNSRSQMDNGVNAVKCIAPFCGGIDVADD